MARKAHEPTDQSRAYVKAMAGYGIPQEDICTVLGISDATLRKHYAHEIATAAIEANARVAESLFKQATGAPAEFDKNGNLVRAEQPRVPACGIFWMKTRGGWRETHRHEHTGRDGKPIQHLDLSRLSDEQLEKFEELLALVGAESAAGGDQGGEGA